MQRREFIALVGSATFTWSRIARSQQSMPVVGFLNSAAPELYTKFLREFRRGLNEMGFVEGQNVVVEYRWAENRYERLPELAAELVRRQVIVILTIRGWPRCRHAMRRRQRAHLGCNCRYFRQALRTNSTRSLLDCPGGPSDS